MKKTIYLLLLFFCATIQAQDTKTTLFSQNQYKSALEGKITKYEILQLPVDRYFEELKSFDKAQEFIIEIGQDDVIPLQIIPEQDLVDRQIVRTATKGLVKSPEVFPYKGHVENSNTYARLTVSSNMFYVYVQGEGFSRFIEPLRFIVPDADPSLYIVYYGEDVILPEGDFCASTQTKKAKNEIHAPQKSTSQDGECFETELALASDFLMYQSYNNSVDDVIARNVGVMNNVQGNYDDEFADEIQFVIVEQYVSDCSTCDPWSSSTDSGVLLTSFRDWGPNGFEEVHDVGHLWSARDFDGTTIGLAYVGVICTGSRYAVLEDFSTNASFIRVLTAHEMGHNFDALHDASGSNTIMAPSVNTATSWSTASINDIEAHYNSRTCLANCAPPAPPVSNFSANLTELCPGATIQFFDESENAPDSWNWTFVGGTPLNSTLQNPTVTYDNPGTYNVTLETTNESGSDQETKFGYITVSSDGFEFLILEDFEDGLDGWTIQNPDNSITWETIVVPGSTGGNTAVYMNNFDYDDGAGDEDGLDTEVIDLSGRESVTLQLEYAFARYNNNFNDRFRIVASTDGGANFTQLLFDGFETGGGNFATSPDQTSEFAPLDASDWCIETTYGPDCITLDLSEFAGEDEFVLRFLNISGYGNNLYVDNISLFANCAVSEPPIANFISDVTSGCADLTVNFQDLSLNSPESWFWSFPGGTPSTSTEQNPTVIYTEAGNYTVSLTASNEVGSNEVTVNSYITVFDEPVADFAADVNGSTVDFTNNSIGGGSYTWDFGDGMSSTQENPVHTYTEDGEYIVVLVVTNICGTNSYSIPVEISTAPVANFEQDVFEGCASFEVQFTNTSSANADTYEWIFPGGTPSASSEENPTVSYTERGVYDVTLIAYNEAGSDTYVAEQTVVVNDVPDIGFTFTINDNTVSFTNTTQFGDTYLWSFGDGETSTDENPVYTYDSDAAYVVTLEATNECGTIMVDQEVVISNLPFASFTVPNTEGCAEFVVNFENNSSSNADSYEWFFEGGSPNTSTEENPIVTYTSAGVYDVTLIATNEEGSDVLVEENYITVGALPEADFSFVQNELMYSFTNESSNGDTYSWNFGDNNTSSQENPVHTYSEDGQYTVVLIVTNACGQDVQEFTVNVVSAVSAGFSTPVTEGCADFEVAFSNESSSNATSFEWSFPGGNPSSSTEMEPVVTYTEAGQYAVTLIVSNDGFTDEITQTNYIIVNDVPVPNFSFDFNMLEVEFFNSTTNADSYEWDFGDNTTSTLENPSHTYDSFGDYSVTLSATNECGTVTETIEISISSLPVANFSSNITSGCTVVEIQFEDLSTSNSDTWEWTFEGGSPSSSSEQNPLISYENAGTFDVSLTVTNESGSDTYTLENYISISSLPLVEVSQEEMGNVVEFSVTSNNTSEFLWIDASTGNTYPGSTAEIEFPADGVYIVELESTNECGTVITSQAVNITAYPDANFTSDFNEGCTPAEIQFMDMTEDDPISFLWSFEGGSPSESMEQNPLVFYNESGSYSVELIAQNEYGNDTIEFLQYINLEDGPTADFEFEINGAEVEFMNTSQGNGSIKWDFGDNTTSEDDNPVHLYDVMGDYIVTLIIDNGLNCQDTITKTLSILVDEVKEIEGSKVSLYPNPNTGFFTLEIDQYLEKDLSYKIVNVVGQVVETGILDVNKSKVNFFSLNLTPGLYFVELNSENDQGILRFVVQ